MDFEHQLGAHLKSKAAGFEVPTRTLELTASPQPRRVPRFAAVAAAGLAVIGFGYGLLSLDEPSPTPTAFPELADVADINAGFTDTSLPPLTGYEWEAIDVPGANFLAFLRSNVSVAEDAFDMVAPTGEIVEPEANWTQWTTDGERLWVIDDSEPTYSILTTSDGSSWGVSSIEFPLTDVDFDLVGVAGDHAILSYRTDRYPGDEFRDLLPGGYQAPGYEYYATPTGVCVLESNTGLAVDTLPYEVLGPEARGFGDLPTTAVTPETKLISVDATGHTTRVPVPIDNASLWMSTDSSSDGWIRKSYSHAQESFFTTDGTLWTSGQEQYESLDVHDGVVYTATDAFGDAGVFRLSEPDSWTRLSPTGLLPDGFHMEQFDVDTFGSALIITHDSENELRDSQWTHGDAALRLTGEGLAISAGGTTTTYPFFCAEGFADPTELRVAPDGHLVFSDPVTERILFETDEEDFAKELDANRRRSTEIPQRYLLLTTDEQNWRQLDITDLVGDRDVTGLYVADRLILIAVDDQVLVGTPPRP